MHLCKQNVLQLKDWKTRACQAVEQMQLVGFRGQDGQREPMLDMIPGRVKFLFPFVTFLCQTIIERICG